MRRWLALCCLTTLYSILWVTDVQAQRTVVVKENDTVWSLAEQYDVLPQDIVKANRLKDPDRLTLGSRLIIPPAVKPTLVPIAMRKSGVINADRVCVRYAPGRTDRSVTLVDKGHPVVVTARKANWLQVKLPSGRMGWVRDDLVKVTGTLVVLQANRSKQRQPFKVASAHKVSHSKKSIQKTKSQRTVKQSNGKPVKVASANPTGSVIVQAASRFRGVRYRWGGSSRSGFDCSGFTRYVFRHKAGIDLPHSSSAQFRKGVPVSRKELKSGDLVFFRTYRRGASHVGIYIGNGKFIHASSSGGRVRVDSMNSGYYRARYVGARRITK